MMTKLLLTIATIVSSQAMAQSPISFNNPISADPIVVKITGFTLAGYSYNKSHKFYDEAGMTRINFYRVNGLSSTYTLSNSKGIIINDNVGVEAEVAESAIKELSLATKECPAKVFINRESIKIAGIKSDCYPAGLAKMVIKSNSSSSYLSSGVDESSNASVTVNTTGAYYSLTFRGTSLASSKSIDAASAKKLTNYLKNAGASCPLTIEFNIQTGAITKASLACDPLALDLNSAIRNG